jgi:periplasmic divalent cation tolerance protein
LRSEVADVILILTTVPSAELGERIGEALVGERLAACVNVLPAMTSIYRWKGAVERDVEHQLVIKTTAERAAAVEARVRQLHTYELPELVVIPAGGGAEAYLAWVGESTREGV